jgi:hypothetical protein
MLLAVLAAPGLMALTPDRVDAQPIVYRAVTVNCNVPGQSITNALKRYVPGNGLLINFSGTCIENIDIFRDDITIHGTTPTATINGPNNTDSVIGIDGARRVRLESFLVTGGRDGVNGTRGSSFTMVGVNVQDAPRFGVIASNNSQASVDNALIKGAGSVGLIAANGAVMFITNTTVEDGQTGIQANRGSHIRIGQDSAGSSTLGPVIVHNNRGSGINIDSSAAAIIVATTVEDNLGSGINITRSAHADIGIGSFNVLGAVTVRNNSTSGTGNGIFVDGGSINLVGSTISGHPFGLQMVNGANGRLGILPDSSAYLGNMITGNRGHGMLISFGATALIGGNTISGNGVAAKNGPALAAGSRSGVFISQASAYFVGHNTIENHLDSGIFARQSQLFLGNGWAALDTTGNLIQNNGCGPEASSNRAGILLFDGSVGEIRSTTITNNCSWNVQLFLGNVLEIRGSTISSAAPTPVTPSAAGAHGILIGTRGIVRIGGGTIIENNSGDGVNMNNGSTFEIRNDISSEIRNNGTVGNTANGFPINCFSGTETSIAIPTTGGVPVFSGNIAGNAPNNCTGF